jgi:phosphatidylserine/phosphatidylglycerophosphate/cardiolipin synthase-like enzyme
MRGVVFVVFVLLMAPSPSYALSSPIPPSDPLPTLSEPANGDAISSSPLIKFVLVCPGKPVESFIIANLDLCEVDLLGLMVSDGEGNLTFVVETILAPGEAIALTTDVVEFGHYMPGISAVSYTTLAKQGSFVLANHGDSLMMMASNGSMMDSFVYGDSNDLTAWSGGAFTPLPEGHAAVRRSTPGPLDSGQASDWALSVLGRQEVDSFQEEAKVRPFLYPDGALDDILETLRRAEDSIFISMYDLNEPSIINSLIEARENKVDVRVLMEGQPVGGMSTSTKRALNDLWRGGCSISLFRSNDSYKRFDYLHGKYAIIDQEYVLIGSENWVASAFKENRGWGVAVHSFDLARQFSSIFQNDSCTNWPDIGLMEAPYPVPSGGGPVSWPDVYSFKDWYSANVTLIVSPDNSLGSMLALICGARERVLIEQMQFDIGFARASGIWEGLSEVAEVGIPVRLLLDATLDDDQSGNQAASTRCNEIGETGSDMEARLVSPFHNFTVVHNKGWVVDDKVVISSVNLVRNAFEENREVGLIIRSPDLADWYAQSFWEDWTVDPIPPSIRLPWMVCNLSKGEPAFLDASACWDNSAIASIEWDLDDDGTIDQIGARCLIEPPPGAHKVRLTITDDHNNTASTVLVVNVSGGEDIGIPSWSYFASIPLVVATGTLWLARKRIKSH